MTSLSIDSIRAQPEVRRYFVIEGMFEGFVEGESLRRFVFKHTLNEIEEEDVVLFVRHLVALQRLAVLTNVTPG